MNKPITAHEIRQALIEVQAGKIPAKQHDLQRMLLIGYSDARCIHFMVTEEGQRWLEEHPAITAAQQQQLQSVRGQLARLAEELGDPADREALFAALKLLDEQMPPTDQEMLNRLTRCC